MFSFIRIKVSLHSNRTLTKVPPKSCLFLVMTKWRMSRQRVRCLHIDSSVFWHVKLHRIWPLLPGIFIF